MKIIHIITGLEFGGAEKMLLDLCTIQRKEHQITIIYFKGKPKLKKTFPEEIKIIHFDLNLHLYSRLKSYLKKEKPDVIHTHLGHADIIGLFASVSIDCAKFCTMHNIWFKHDRRDKLIFLIYRVIFRHINKNVKVISISKNVYHHCKTRLCVSDANHYLLYNAIPSSRLNINKLQAQEELDMDHSKYHFLFIGRLSKQKSVSTLILAANELLSKSKDFLINIIGEGERRGALDEMVEKYNLHNYVKFRGVTYNTELFLKSADAFVLPSIFEGFGIVIIEAFREQLPVIATNIEGPGELIEEGINGLLFQPGDYKELADKMYVLMTDQNLSQELSTNGFKTYENAFRIEDYSNRLLKYYQDAIRKN